MFNKNFDVKVKQVYEAVGGNFVCVSLRTMEADLLLVNVYSPNRDSPEFNDELEDRVNEMGLPDMVNF